MNPQTATGIEHVNPLEFCQPLFTGKSDFIFVSTVSDVMVEVHCLSNDVQAVTLAGSRIDLSELLDDKDWERILDEALVAFEKKVTS